MTEIEGLDAVPKGLIDAFNSLHKEYTISEAKKKEILKRIKEKYVASKISPGEAIGIITAESFGEPSTQMCVSYDEKVITKVNNKIKIARIGELIDRTLNSRSNVSIKNGYEFCNGVGISILALNNNEKLEWKNVSRLNRHKAPKKLIHIITRSGRKITATDFHSFVTRKNNSVISIAGKDLKVGSKIPVINYLPEHCASTVNVCDYVDFPSASSHNATRLYRPTKFIPSTISLDESFGWFIGAYLAEGCAEGGQVCISNLDKRYIQNAKRFIAHIGLDFTEKFHNRGFAPSRDLIINSSLLAKFISTACGKGSRNKFIPEFAYSAKEEFVSGLLRGYFDGDANFTTKRKMIRVSSNSEELLDGIKLLLTRFGIFAFKSKDHKQYYLIISCKYTPLFLNNIGSDIPYKKQALKKLAKLADKKIVANYRDYTDTIGGFGTLLIDISKKLRLPTRYVNSATKRKKVGRTALMRYIHKFENTAKKKNINVSDELDILRKAVNSDVVWDDIVKIEYTPYSHNYVYDLTVPELHTFTTFDGIITHNTLNTFHLAGVAEVDVTIGLPRLIELFDARKQPSTPMMTVFIEKPNNRDPKKVKQIAESIKETKLEDVADEFSINVFGSHIEITLNEKRMRDIKIDIGEIKNAILKSLVDSKVNINGNKLTVHLKKSENPPLKEAYAKKEKLKDLFLNGIKGVSRVLPIKKDDEYVILTLGSNLKNVFKIKEVDASRTISNDIYEVANLLGIEAARQLIIEESKTVIGDQGLDINIRHIMLIADIMCVRGSIKGITRSGITGDKASVLARSSFETPIKHLVNATLIGEKDELNSVIENVMVNQQVPLGTGLPDLIVKMLNKGEKG